MIKIAFDISTTQTGICVLWDNEIKYSSNIKLPMFKYEEKTLKEISRKIKSEIVNVVYVVEHCVLEQGEKIILGSELSNFENPELNQKFSWIGSQIFLWFSIFYKGEFEYKQFNANQWQRLLLGWTPNKDKSISKKEARQALKDKSREFTKSHCDRYIGTWTEDQCDAFCIAYILEKLEGKEDLKQRISLEHRKNKRIKQLESNLKSLRVKLHREKKDLLKSKQYQKWEKELKELKNEKETK